MKNWTVQMKDNDMNIFNDAKWEGFTVNRHERYTDGAYVVSSCGIPMVFLSGNKLYCPFFSPFGSTITSLIPLNMDKDDKTCGVYFSIT